MIIKKVKCDCFAGLRDRDYTFDTGLNLVIGENESGKSTLVDLLYHLFFQNTAYDGRKDNCKKFQELYIPKSTGTKGDSIDGEIRFETEKGTYKLWKEWLKSKNGAVKMTLPDGTTIRDSETIKTILDGVLGYGKGVYDELIFASQRRNHTILSSLLGNKISDSIGELSVTLTKAVMETGGISIEGMEKELRETVSSYEGKWDFDADMPKDGRSRGINNKWSIKKEKAKILHAYYYMKEIAKYRDEAEDAERKVDKINADILAAKQKLGRLKSLRERFSSIRSLLSAQIANRTLLQNAEVALQTMQSVLSVWPSQAEQASKVKRLKEQFRQAKIKELYKTVSGLIDSRETTSDALEHIGIISQTDVDAATSLEDKIRRSESILRGMNLTARIRKLGETEVLVTSAASGDALTNDNDEIDITEAVDIRVRGVVEIQLAPKGVDVDSVRTELANAREELAAILDSYGVSSADELKKKQQKAKDLSYDLAGVNDKISAALGEKTWDALCAEVALIPGGIKSSEEIAADIGSLCGDDSIDGFIGRIGEKINGYVNDYGSPEALSDAIERKNDQVKELEEKIQNAGSVPEEFQDITDSDDYAKNLETQIDQLDGEDGVLEQLREDLLREEKKLGEKSAEEYAEEYLQAQMEFENLKVDYVKWKHILDVFIKVKNDARGNPLADVEKYFRENLSILSDGNLVLSNIGDNFGSKISSGNNSLTADILSDGTKDTIELAFRLAVLKHLFPDGGCVAVFDDPFTDMDPKRTAQACNLIQSFAENNQVIFVSCDEKYLDSMAGNVIRISR